VKRWRHRLAHLLGLNYGMPITFWHDGIFMVGFRCAGCGELLGVIRA
jgi:hypothetical protein